MVDLHKYLWEDRSRGLALIQIYTISLSSSARSWDFMSKDPQERCSFIPPRSVNFDEVEKMNRLAACFKVCPLYRQQRHWGLVPKGFRVQWGSFILCLSQGDQPLLLPSNHHITGMLHISARGCQAAKANIFNLTRLSIHTWTLDSKHYAFILFTDNIYIYIIKNKNKKGP